MDERTAVPLPGTPSGAVAARLGAYIASREALVCHLASPEHGHGAWPTCTNRIHTEARDLLREVGG